MQWQLLVLAAVGCSCVAVDAVAEEQRRRIAEGFSCTWISTPMDSAEGGAEVRFRTSIDSEAWEERQKEADSAEATEARRCVAQLKFQCVDRYSRDDVLAWRDPPMAPMWPRLTRSEGDYMRLRPSLMYKGETYYAMAMA